MRPVPDEIWVPLMRRIESFNALLLASCWAMWIATAIMLLAADAWPELVIRFGAPLGVLGVITGAVGKHGGRRALRQMRMHIIYYTGHDPEQPR